MMRGIPGDDRGSNPIINAIRSVVRQELHVVRQDIARLASMMQKQPRRKEAGASEAKGLDEVLGGISRKEEIKQAIMPVPHDR